MVQRTSQAVSFNVGQATGQQQSSAAFERADLNKYKESRIHEAPRSMESASDRVLQSLFATVGKLAEKGFEQSQRENYLEGVAQAGVIESEEALNTNPVMRDWQRAGYRDTMGRLAAADNEAQIAQDMAKMREVSPEKYAEYLAERRGAMTAQWSGMTMQTRETMFAQQMMNERAAIKKHGAEHAKFGIETEQKSIKAVVGTSFNALTAAKGDLAAYGAATDAAYTTLYSSILANPKLPTQLKGKMLAEAATYALENDHQALYEQINTRTMKGENGTKGTMADSMEWDDATALSKAYSASRTRTEAFRAADYMERSARFEADWQNPNTELMPYAAVEAHLNEGVQRKLVSADQLKSAWAKWHEHGAKKLSAAGLAARYAAGDQQGMLQLGKTSEEGLNAYVDVLGRKMSLPQITDNLLTIGLQTGQGNAFRKVGQLLGPAFAQLGNGDNMDPANAASVAQTLQRLDKADKVHAGAFSQFLGAFDPEVQAKISYLRDNLGTKGMSPPAAIAAAEARVLEDAKTPASMRAALAATKSKEIVDAANEITPRGILGTIQLGAAALFGSEDASNEMKITTRSKWFENKERVDQVMWGAKVAVQQHMTEIATNNPHLSIDAVKSMALSAVASRTVDTDWGPLLVPKGQTPQRFFKVGDDVGAERISAAMHEFIKPAEGNRIAFSLGTGGQLMYQELNERGKPAAAARIIDPAVVGPMVQKQRVRQHEEFKLDHGEGIVKKYGNVTLRFNGDNTSQIDNGWVRRFRGDLVAHEGVSDTVYKDKKGNETIGVGILVRGGGVKPDANGKISEEQVNQSFLRASDRAAATASRVMKGTGLSNEDAFKFYASLAYQRGLGFAQLPEYRPVLTAMKLRDAAAAEAAFKATNVFKASQPERQQFYLKSLKAATKG